ncbi:MULTISPECIES: VOC family protein [Enterobacter]|uniref:VOC family protein n=1 Tax=Enterobacter TaxID=547 RepID=UPI003974CD63|nr:VOC family protein [Klebsiella sp. T2.Ur]
MFDHVKFGVSDYERCKAFFVQALKPLGIRIVDEGTPEYGVEMSAGDVSLCLFQTHEKPAPLHLAFVAETRQQVDAFYAAALSAGARDNGAPGLRPYGKHYYAAFVIAPDGHNIEAVCHAPV